jgi:integrase
VAKKIQRLTALGISKLKLGIVRTGDRAGQKQKKVRFADGANLFLTLDDKGSRTWSFIYRSADGKSPELGLGAYPDVDLKAARAQARKYRALLREGHDPKAAKAQARRPVAAKGATTFGAAMEHFLDTKSAGWRNERNARQIAALLHKHCAKIVDTQADQVVTADVLKIVAPVFKKAPVQGARLLRQIEGVLKTAYALDDIQPRPANPARWRDHLSELLPKRKSTDAAHHHALPYVEIPSLMTQLREADTEARKAGVVSVGVLGLQFLILTAARTDEVLSARWDEIDIANREWRIPGSRMKSGRPHNVPLCDAAIAILEAMPRVAGNPFVFPGRDRPPADVRRQYKLASEQAQKEGQKPPRRPSSRRPATLTAETFLRVLRSLNRETTTHGLRSAFRDWAGDCSKQPREIAEAALAHVVGDRTERAYRRGDAFARRRELMEEWASFLETVPGDNVVVQFPRRA